ncbi:MAG TPA: TrkH family potassium uptake protein [Gammaproteobacteria bacterium]|nr:TrkH family potassium uptake protein [Gammaproteobacteria bacterium]
MQFLVIQRIMGLLLMLFSLTMLPCIVLSWFDQDGGFAPFLKACLITLMTGFLLWLPVRRQGRELRTRDAFVIVSLFWTLLALFGALPFQFVGTTSLMVDAYFETMSGLTTSGSTVLTGLDHLAPSMNLWRGILQFMGGMGIVVLAVAILPMLGVGGMQLYKAETPGPMKESKLTPRIRETAKALWYIYLGLTAACALALWAAGMTPFDALIHSFATVSTGGFSTHDASIAYFNSPTIEMVLTLFMFLGGTSFALHFLAFRGRSLRSYWQDTEFRIYLAIVLTATVSIALYLYLSATYPTPLESLRYAVFQVVTMATTTGYMSADFGAWPPVLGALLLIISFFGGSAGSTSGGMKVVRVVLLFKQTLCEIQRLIHPHAIVPLKLSGKPVPERTIAAVSAFFATYLASFTIIALSISAMGVDLVTAFSATAAAINNTGPGLGAVGPAANFAALPEAAKWLLSLAMLLGRLELFTLFVILTPAFWRK